MLSAHDPLEFLKSEVADYMNNARIALAISSCAAPDQPLLHVNRKFSDLSGFSADEVVSRNCRFLQRELREQDGRFRMREFIRNPGRNQMRCSLVNFRRDGSPFVNLVYLSRIRSSNEQECYIFASQFEVAEHKTAAVENYDRDLRKAAVQLTRIVSEHDMMMDQTVDMLANTASMIAQSKMALKHLRDQAV